MKTGLYRITPLDVGRVQLGLDHVLGDGYSADDRIEFALVSFLIRGGGKNVLVDLGPKTLDYTNAMFRTYGFLRTMPDGSTPDDIVQRQGNVFDGLARMGLEPAEVSDIIFTHLHADHHGMDDARDGGACEDFPNAVFHLSKAGWDYNVGRRKDGQWDSYLDWAFGDSIMRKMAEGKAIAHDNAEIAPGLSTIYLGGHAPCSQAVRVETGDSIVVIGSDDFYRYDLMEKGVIAKLFTTREKLIEADGMLADWAIGGATIIPVHDPTVLDLYETHCDAWINAAGALSRKAGEGFRRVWPASNCSPGTPSRR